MYTLQSIAEIFVSDLVAFCSQHKHLYLFLEITHSFSLVLYYTRLYLASICPPYLKQKQYETRDLILYVDVFPFQTGRMMAC